MQASSSAATISAVCYNWRMTEPTLLSLIRQVRAQRRSQPDTLEGERLRLEGSLIEFVEEAWPFIDAAPYQPNWAIDALCEHLQVLEATAEVSDDAVAPDGDAEDFPPDAAA